jgi:hypothetical protein
MVFPLGLVDCAVLRKIRLTNKAKGEWSLPSSQRFHLRKSRSLKLLKDFLIGPSAHIFRKKAINNILQTVYR